MKVKQKMKLPSGFRPESAQNHSLPWENVSPDPPSSALGGGGRGRNENQKASSNIYSWGVAGLDRPTRHPHPSQLVRRKLFFGHTLSILRAPASGPDETVEASAMTSATPSAASRRSAGRSLRPGPGASQRTEPNLPFRIGYENCNGYFGLRPPLGSLSLFSWSGAKAAKTQDHGNLKWPSKRSR